MKISITAEHIKNGKRNSCTDCPVALALLEKNYDAYVSCRKLTVRKTPADYHQPLYVPQTVRTFINNFDGGLEVFPFSFNTKKKREF